jgi:hypothetical protein
MRRHPLNIRNRNAFSPLCAGGYDPNTEHPIEGWEPRNFFALGVESGKNTTPNEDVNHSFETVSVCTTRR